MILFYNKTIPLVKDFFIIVFKFLQIISTLMLINFSIFKMKLLKDYAILICRTSRAISKSQNNIIENCRLQNIKKGELR